MMGKDGEINLGNNKSECFFPFKKYGNIACYEVLCQKK